MKTSEISDLKNRISQLRSTLYFIAYGDMDLHSARSEAERAMKLDNKLKQEVEHEMGLER